MLRETGAKQRLISSSLPCDFTSYALPSNFHPKGKKKDFVKLLGKERNTETLRLQYQKEKGRWYNIQLKIWPRNGFHKRKYTTVRIKNFLCKTIIPPNSFMAWKSLYGRKFMIIMYDQYCIMFLSLLFILYIFHHQYSL